MLTEVLTLALIFSLVETNMEPRVVHGHPIDINEVPHSVFIQISSSSTSYICGSSILNQKILLTAGHCIAKCLDGVCQRSFAYTGHVQKGKGKKYKLVDFIVHKKYKHRRVNNDIGLALLQNPIKLGQLAKRIIINRRPQLNKKAIIAGWGMINEIKDTRTELLHYTTPDIVTFEECRKIIRNLPDGCLCTGQFNDEEYASLGDSGSALVVNNYIQIGLVSYKRPDISLSIVVFTNVSYYYDWIKEKAKELYCKKETGL